MIFFHIEVTNLSVQTRAKPLHPGKTAHIALTYCTFAIEVAAQVRLLLVFKMKGDRSHLTRLNPASQQSHLASFTTK
jgi:hypothetical protein